MANKYSRLYDKACGQFNSNFRELFDYLSEEYNLKDDNYRIEKLAAVVKEKYSLHALIQGYKYHYTKKLDKAHVPEEIAPSCILVLKHASSLLGDDPATKLEIGKLESAMVFNRVDERELIQKLTEIVKRINKLLPSKMIAPKKKKTPVKSADKSDLP